MQTTSSIWTSIENSDDTNYLALEGTNEAGEDFKVLLSWEHLHTQMMILQLQFLIIM